MSSPWSARTMRSVTMSLTSRRPASISHLPMRAAQCGAAAERHRNGAVSIEAIAASALMT
jgi:hypothetical protein